jgi:chromosome segregation ATPase
MSQKIDELIGTGVIEKTKGDYIKEKFQDFTEAIEEWSEKANAIVVTEETQKELMAEAREGRLLLKSKRIEVEKVRKSLKEQSLSEGRLIDSVAKYLTGLIEPAEKHLELQEKFIEIQEQNKRIQLKAERTELLQPYKDVIDPSSIQLDLITDEAFTTILNGAKFAQENKKAEALRAEEERKETERKNGLFQERRLQIVEFKQFYDASKDLFLTIDSEQNDFDSLMEDLRFRKNEYLKAQAKIAKENETLKKQNEKKAQEILKLKKEAKQTPTSIPAQKAETSNAYVADKDSDIRYVETQNEDIIMVKRSEYERLKTKYAIVKPVVEVITLFIVPQGLRDLANKALKDIAEADKI